MRYLRISKVISTQKGFGRFLYIRSHSLHEILKISSAFSHHFLQFSILRSSTPHQYSPITFNNPQSLNSVDHCLNSSPSFLIRSHTSPSAFTQKLHRYAFQHDQLFQACHSGSLCHTIHHDLSRRSRPRAAYLSYCYGTRQDLWRHCCYDSHFHWSNSVSLSSSSTSLFLETYQNMKY